MAFAKYYKNFILCGDADYHCILCDETFCKLEDIEKHIRWEKHRKMIKSQTCLPKFKNNGIFKIGSFNYCQYCNQVFNNIKSVKEHIATEKHKVDKTTPEATSKRIEARHDSGNITIHKVKINNLQWHAIHNKHCLLCNVAVENALKHIQTQTHIIRLIQSETKYEGEDKCYRRVNDTTYQCFTCTNTFILEDFDKHWLEHNNKTTTESQTPDSVPGTQKRIYTWSEYKKLGNSEYDVSKLENIEDEFFKVDMKNKDIICKKCNNAVKNTKNDLESHLENKHEIISGRKSNIIKQISEDIDKEYLFIYEKDSGKARHECAVYGKENYIKLNAGGGKGYCMLCDRFLSTNINVFKQHVEGNLHVCHLEFQGHIKAKKHARGLTGTDSLFRLINKIEYLTELDAVAINRKITVDRDSFLLIKRIEHGKYFKLTKCFVCDVTFKFWEEKKHCETKTHKAHVLAAKVVIGIDEFTFIREIKPKLYHCGFCNVTMPYWETLAQHMENMSHKCQVMAKMYKDLMKRTQEHHGSLPDAKNIERSGNSDTFYSNIIKILYENTLGDIRIFTIDLQKLQESKANILILST